MKEFIAYALVIIGLLFGIAILNSLTNDIKAEKCAKVGGTLIKNISDAGQTTCIMGK